MSLTQNAATDLILCEGVEFLLHPESVEYHRTLLGRWRVVQVTTAQCERSLRTLLVWTFLPSYSHNTMTDYLPGCGSPTLHMRTGLLSGPGGMAGSRHMNSVTVE